MSKGVRQRGPQAREPAPRGPKSPSKAEGPTPKGRSPKLEDDNPPQLLDGMGYKPEEVLNDGPVNQLTSTAHTRKLQDGDVRQVLFASPGVATMDGPVSVHVRVVELAHGTRGKLRPHMNIEEESLLHEGSN